MFSIIIEIKLTNNLVPRSLIDEGEIWSNPIFTRDCLWQAVKERMLEVNPQFSMCWCISEGQGVVKACSQLYACISSLLIKPELHLAELGSYRGESTFSGWWIKFLLMFFEEHVLSYL